MSDFGDSEPEDSWHPDDPVPVLLDNIRRRIILLVIASKLGDWTPREQLRSDQINGDLQFLIERIQHGG
jgi:hypothetical protein